MVIGFVVLLLHILFFVVSVARLVLGAQAAEEDDEA